MEILKELSKPSPGQQRMVLDYVRSLRGKKPKGISGKELLKLRGLISPEDAREMGRIIEEGCERVADTSWGKPRS